MLLLQVLLLQVLLKGTRRVAADVLPLPHVLGHVIAHGSVPLLPACCSHCCCWVPFCMRACCWQGQHAGKCQGTRCCCWRCLHQRVLQLHDNASSLACFLACCSRFRACITTLDSPTTTEALQPCSLCQYGTPLPLSSALLVVHDCGVVPPLLLAYWVGICADAECQKWHPTSAHKNTKLD